jgi:hypothetical protein
MVRNFAVASGRQMSSAPAWWKGREEPVSETKRDDQVSHDKQPVHSRLRQIERLRHQIKSEMAAKGSE